MLPGVKSCVRCFLFFLSCAMMWEGLEWPWAREFPCLCSGCWYVLPWFRVALGGCGTPGGGVAAPSVMLPSAAYLCVWIHHRVFLLGVAMLLVLLVILICEASSVTVLWVLTVLLMWLCCCHSSVVSVLWYFRERVASSSLCVVVFPCTAVWCECLSPHCFAHAPCSLCQLWGNWIAKCLGTFSDLICTQR